MTFKGDKIVGKPTLAMVEIYIAEKGLFCDAKEPNGIKAIRDEFCINQKQIMGK